MILHIPSSEQSHMYYNADIKFVYIIKMQENTEYSLALLGFSANTSIFFLLQTIFNEQTVYLY